MDALVEIIGSIADAMAQNKRGGKPIPPSAPLAKPTPTRGPAGKVPRAKVQRGAPTQAAAPRPLPNRVVQAFLDSPILPPADLPIAPTPPTSAEAFGGVDSTMGPQHASRPRRDPLAAFRSANALLGSVVASEVLSRPIALRRNDRPGELS